MTRLSRDLREIHINTVKMHIRESLQVMLCLCTCACACACVCLCMRVSVDCMLSSSTYVLRSWALRSTRMRHRDHRRAPCDGTSTGLTKPMLVRPAVVKTLPVRSLLTRGFCWLATCSATQQQILRFNAVTNKSKMKISRLLESN